MNMPTKMSQMGSLRLGLPSGGAPPSPVGPRPSRFGAPPSPLGVREGGPGGLLLTASRPAVGPAAQGLDAALDAPL